MPRKSSDLLGPGSIWSSSVDLSWTWIWISSYLVDWSKLTVNLAFKALDLYIVISKPNIVVLDLK